ncbi:hypothetical protein C8J57DRAFT_1242516 [Mycena rebaudengoi]|nr:hypothetical protein C8J57DRAFT_1242516 [Mycena rebaudengoi]
MFGFSKLSFMALVATASLRSVTSVPTDLAIGNRTASIGSTSGPLIVIIICTGANFQGCVSIPFGHVPTGCFPIPSNLNNAASSAQAVRGIRCTIFDSAACSGRSAIIGGNVANLGDLGMNDLASSITCIVTL